MSVTIHHGDCLEILPTLAPGCVQTIVTSPPYFRLRDYGVAPTAWPAVAFTPMPGLPSVTIPAQTVCLGLEADPLAYTAHLVHVFRLARPALRDDGIAWLNLGDSYAQDSKWGGRSGGKNYTSDAAGLSRQRKQTGLKDKDLMLIPARVALALQADGWYVRNQAIWWKPNAMPESVTDRLTNDYEPLYLLAKSPRYYFDQVAIAEPVERNDRPQYMRAVEIARDAGLTNEHIDAIRAVGITDTGKAQTTQTGYGKNDPRVQALADEAKAVLKGYYREFLTVSAADSFKLSRNREFLTVSAADSFKLSRNRRAVWRISTEALRDKHYAPMPEKLVEPCILAGARPGDTVLDMFAGSGTTLRVAERFGRHGIGIELNQAYIEIQERRTDGVQVHMDALL